MASFVYQNVFGGTTIYPSDVSYNSLTLTSDIILSLPLEDVPENKAILARIMDITSNQYKNQTFSATSYTLASAGPMGSTTITLTGGVTGPFSQGALFTFVNMVPNVNTTPPTEIYTVVSSTASGNNTSVTFTPALANAKVLGQDIWIYTPTYYTITLPDAMRAGVGETTLFFSGGLTPFQILDAAGNQVVYTTPSEYYQIYLKDNSTTAGVWGNVQYGVGTVDAQSATLAGPGLVPYSTQLASAIPVVTISSNYIFSPSDRAKAFVWLGGSGTFSLPNANTVNNNWFVGVRNQGTGLLTVNTIGQEFINGLAVFNLQPGDSVTLITDGFNYYTLGYGRAVSSNFDYTSIDVSGAPTGVYILQGSQENRVAYNFTGLLTQNTVVQVPLYIQQYWVSNSTTGNYTLRVRAGSVDTGILLEDGARTILYCDGAVMRQADNNNLPIPIPIGSGGTGATSANDAVTNLGATAIGGSIFRATNAADVFNSIGGGPAILNVIGATTLGTSLIQATSSANVIASLGAGTVGNPMFIANTTAQAIQAMGGVTAVNAILLAQTPTFGDVVSLAVALG